MKVLYTRAALEDLLRLRQFIAESDESVARRVANDLMVRVEALAHYPNLGRMVVGITAKEFVRDFILGSYHVRYIVQANEIYILRVWHTKEDR